MIYSTGSYPSVRVDSTGEGVVSQAGGLVLARAAHVPGLGAGLSEALGPGGSRLLAMIRARSSRTWLCRWLPAGTVSLMLTGFVPSPRSMDWWPRTPRSVG